MPDPIEQQQDPPIDLSGGLVTKVHAPGQAPPPGDDSGIDLSAGLVPKQAKPPASDTGFLAGLGRVGSGIVHTPSAIYHAFTDPPRDEDEHVAAALQGHAGLGIHRLIAKPLQQEADLADQYQTAATGSTDVPPLERGFDFGFGNTPQERAQHLANMHRLASVVPVFGPLAGNLTERFVGGDKSGATAELLANMVAPKAIEGTLKAPLWALNKTTGALPGVAEYLYGKALKPSTTLSAADRASVIRTGLEAGIPVSEEGLGKLSALTQDLADKVTQMIKA